MAAPELAARLAAAGFRGRLRQEAPLAPHTTWRIGGPAELLALPLDRADVRLAACWAFEQGLPWRVLGNGSNLLVRDQGVRGLVLRVCKVLGEVRSEGQRLECGAGALFPAVANLAAAQGLAGIEFGAGIPGTLGGAVVMNGGWHQDEISNVIGSVEFLEEDGSIRVHDHDACHFRYRGSRFHGRPGVVLGATLALNPDEPARILARMEAYSASRKQNQPTELPSCGSVFLKPQGDFAGRLIEQAGLKGLRVGDIQVSPKHANFFVNLGRGTAADALALVERVEQAVETAFGIVLVREFELW